MSPAEQITLVVAKTRQLVELCGVLQEQNDLLEGQNTALQEALNKAQVRLEECDKQIKALRLAQGIQGAGTAATAEMKQKITDFVKDIDKCITVLRK